MAMATLSELVDAISTVEGMDPATVTLMGRYIREGGFIATKGRGPSAADMTIEDATNLVIGVNAAKQASEAASAVAIYGQLVAQEPLSKLARVSRKRFGTLAEGIGQLIRAAETGELPDEFLRCGVSDELREAFHSRRVHTEIRFRKSSPSATIKISRDILEKDVSTPEFAEYILEQTGGADSLYFQFYPARPIKSLSREFDDRMDETRIGYKTIRAIGEMVRFKNCL